jgi:hypothetical protein
MKTRSTKLRWAAAVVLAVGVIALAFLAGRALLSQDSSTTIEAESMTLPSGSAVIHADSDAVGEKAVKFAGNATVRSTVTTSATTRELRIRARGTSCQGEPIASLSIDGVERQRSTINTSSRYKSYRAAVSLPSGTHSVKLAFVNDFYKSDTPGCDRNLIVDSVALRTSATDAATTPTPSPRAPASRRPTAVGRLFEATYESGKIVPPWFDVQACPPISSATVVTDPVLNGARAMKNTVSGTCSFGSQRSEALGEPSVKYTEGEERYFGDSVYFPPEFPATQEGHCLTMQIHTQQRGGHANGPAWSLNCRDAPEKPPHVLLRTAGGGCEWQTELPRGTWLHFVLRMKFSTDASIGGWDLWYRAGDGDYTKVASDCRVAALLSSTDYGYYKVGLYRGTDNTDSVTVFHDDSRVGTTFASVAQ